MKQDRDYRGPGQYVVSTAMIPPPRSEPPPPPPRADGTAAYECQCCAESAEVEALRTELSNTRASYAEAIVEIAELRVLVDARNRVVEAAKAWRREHPDGYRSDDLKTLQPRVMAHNDLAAAVDALSTPPPGEGE